MKGKDIHESIDKLLSTIRKDLDKKNRMAKIAGDEISRHEIYKLMPQVDLEPLTRKLHLGTSIYEVLGTDEDQIIVMGDGVLLRLADEIEKEISGQGQIDPQYVKGLAEKIRSVVEQAKHASRYVGTEPDDGSPATAYLSNPPLPREE